MLFSSSHIHLAESSWQWKVLVLDEGSKKIIDNVVKEDDILNENIASMQDSTLLC
jgi:hypothetical protein